MHRRHFSQGEGPRLPCPRVPERESLLAAAWLSGEERRPLWLPRLTHGGWAGSAPAWQVEEGGEQDHKALSLLRASERPQCAHAADPEGEARGPSGGGAPVGGFSYIFPFLADQSRWGAGVAPMGATDRRAGAGCASPARPGLNPQPRAAGTWTAGPAMQGLWLPEDEDGCTRAGKAPGASGKPPLELKLGGGGGPGRAPGTPPRGRFGSFSQEDAGAEKLGDPLPWALGGGAQTGRPWGPAGP